MPLLGYAWGAVAYVQAFGLKAIAPFSCDDGFESPVARKLAAVFSMSKMKKGSNHDQNLDADGSVCCGAVQCSNGRQL